MYDLYSILLFRDFLLNKQQSENDVIFDEKTRLFFPTEDTSDSSDDSDDDCLTLMDLFVVQKPNRFKKRFSNNRRKQWFKKKKKGKKPQQVNDKYHYIVL